MAENERNPQSGTDNPLNSYAKYTGMAFQMIVIIGLFAFVGYKIDEGAKHTTQWVTATLSLVGVFISLYLIIRSVNK